MREKIRPISSSKILIVPKREVLKLPDGGGLALDWVIDDQQYGIPPPESPTLLVLHGLNGGSDAKYAR